MSDDDPAVDENLFPYPPADITPREFEEWVADMLAAAGHRLEGLRVTLHDKVSGVDGSYDFDATVQYRWAGLEFVVVVEAKLHSNPIKRDVVQVLRSKVQSVGAHKGVLISTARFQSGAIEFARVHGIALVHITEGRFTILTRAAAPSPILSREEAAALQLPTFVGYCFGPGDAPDSITTTLISADYPEHATELLLDVPCEVL